MALQECTADGGAAVEYQYEQVADGFDGGYEAEYDGGFDCGGYEE